ncbi:MAG: hypothetical protein HS111_10090 [Kofleriaceae bacterium]|nr:hypothetical protein [Kofleriaceae bacterium]
MRVEDKLQLLVQGFVTQVTELARQVAVDTLASALSAPASTAAGPRVNGHGRGAPGRGKRVVGVVRGRKRPAGELERLSVRFLDHVKANPGQRIEQINRALGTRTAELRGPVVKLVAAKEIKTRGQRRAMTYFAT